MEGAERPTVVAIDGPAGSGKSTLARRLALELGLPYVNTGLMYRAVTLEAIERGIDPGDAEALTAIAAGLTFDLDLDLRPPELRIEGSPPDPGLTSPEVERTVSQVSAHAPLRAVLRERQRRLGSNGAVMEGRDIGSVVFPDATLKVVLGAGPGERAARRALEREARAVEVSAAIAERDARDERNVPPVEADLEVDSTHLGPDEVLAIVLAEVRRRQGEAR
ncbi:MAG TPA: (d)CMP kinase [Actinomycetota bacterium]|nr:(d)CMP kinase [Actinomycetota bacterium]